jgi:hypothetical protein
MIISSDLEFFQTVYLVTDPDQKKRIVTEITLKPGNVIVYSLSCGVEESVHYREEITTEQDEAKKLLD